MHVLDFTTFYPPHVGGVEAFAAALHQEMLRRPGWRVSVVTSEQGQPLPSGPEGRLQIRTYPAWAPVSGFGAPTRSPLALARELPGPPVDVVLSHTRFYPASWLAGRFARRHRARWVHIEHGGSAVASGPLPVRAVAAGYDRTLGRSVLRGADRVVSVSTGSAEFVRELSGVEAVVARRGITLPESPWSNPPGGRALFVGRLVRSKGIIEAVSALRDTGVGLDVVGEGPDASSMEKQAADLGVEARFHGAVDGSAVAAHMRRARLLLHPSHTEGLPTVVLEAAALGLPVVATDVGGTREIVSGTDDGWLVPARDQARLDAAVREALAAPELASTRGATARAGVGEHFSWDAVIDAITEGVVPRA